MPQEGRRPRAAVAGPGTSPGLRTTGTGRLWPNVRNDLLTPVFLKRGKRIKHIKKEFILTN